MRPLRAGASMLKAHGAENLPFGRPAPPPLCTRSARPILRQWAARGGSSAFYQTVEPKLPLHVFPFSLRAIRAYTRGPPPSCPARCAANSSSKTAAALPAVNFLGEHGHAEWMSVSGVNTSVLSSHQGLGARRCLRCLLIYVIIDMNDAGTDTL